MTDCVIRRDGHRIIYFRFDDEVWVDADLGIWRWGWEDKLLEAEGK
jgi:hypothetical protein